MQVKAMDQSSGQVNAVSGKPHSKGIGKRTAQGRGRGNKPGKPSSSSQETKVSGCLCCNYTDHMTSDQNCPTRSKKCNSYSEIGHFLQSVAKQRNSNLPQEMTREGIMHGGELTNYQRIQPLANKIIMHLRLESVSLKVVVK